MDSARNKNGEPRRGDTASRGDSGSEANGFGQFGHHADRAVDEAGRNVRSSFDGIVDYFREHGLDEVVGDVTRYVRSHPAQALIGAIALGFIAGRTARRS